MTSIQSIADKHAAKQAVTEKPLAGGTMNGRQEFKAPLPKKGQIKRYILTSAQNNTYVNQDFWKNLVALADFYDAQIYVGTFTYNKNAYGKLAVKRGTKGERQGELWYDVSIKPFIDDRSIELAPGLIWCGEMNILPTAVDPLAGLETYTHRMSSIFPHAKLAMRSVATMQGDATKFMYTTGAVTQRNYIQKKEGIKAEHHHRYAALVVEINDKGNWWVRQIGMGSKARTVQDLSIVVKDGKVTKGASVEAITWGDLHATMRDESVTDLSIEMLDALKPRYQFLHDVLEGASINRHQRKTRNPHSAFHVWLRGYHRVDVELKDSAAVIRKYLRKWCKTVIPDSNHDGWWLKSWLAEFDYRVDPANAELFLKLQAFTYEQIRMGVMPRDVNILSRALQLAGLEPGEVKCLLSDESYTICNQKIECGMHGHLGPNGSRGTPQNLNKIGRRANTGHTHSAGIWNGLYVAGTSSQLKWDYNHGPSSWSNSHVVTYANGQRAIVTMFAGRWRA